MDVTSRIRALMQERGWSEYRLANESKLSQSTIANIFSRETTPSIATLEAICEAFGISLSQFFAEGTLVSLSVEQETLFKQWITLTDKEKSAINHLIQVMKDR